MGEMSLVKFVKKVDGNLYRALCYEWHRHHDIYLCRDLALLIRALENEASPYHYRLNYPIARGLAIALFNGNNTEIVKNIFENHALDQIMPTYLRDDNAQVRLHKNITSYHMFLNQQRELA